MNCCNEMTGQCQQGDDCPVRESHALHPIGQPMTLQPDPRDLLRPTASERARYAAAPRPHSRTDTRLSWARVALLGYAVAALVIFFFVR